MEDKGVCCSKADLGTGSSRSLENEKKTLVVIMITFVTMAAEITTGYLTNSMALLADGWHMGTHVLALGIAYVSYYLARKLSSSGKFSFGTGKFGVLGGFTSAIVLGITGLAIILESFERIFNPENIIFMQAIIVAVLGLTVNLVCLLILHQPHSYEEEDHNHKAAYLHVLTDALTSILAIVALVCGSLMGWIRLDAAVGILGGVMIVIWSVSLIKKTSLILLDGGASAEFYKAIYDAIEGDEQSKVLDLHAWRIDSSSFAVVLSVENKGGHTTKDYYKRLQNLKDVKHLSIEICKR